MKSKPWYIWLSVFSLFALIVVSMFQYFPLFTKKKDSAMGTWLSFCGNVFLTWFILLILPLVLIALLIELMSNTFPFLGFEGLGSILIFICMYFFGVNASFRHLKWRNKHIES